MFKGLKVNRIVLPLTEEEQICPVCGTQMELIGEEYVRRELVFVPAKCEINEYYSQNYSCHRQIKGSFRSGWKGTCIIFFCCMDDVSEVCKQYALVPPGKRLEAVWC